LGFGLVVIVGIWDWELLTCCEESEWYGWDCENFGFEIVILILILVDGFGFD
jgi:hypothetical protein